MVQYVIIVWLIEQMKLNVNFSKHLYLEIKLRASSDFIIMLLYTYILIKYYTLNFWC